MASDGGKEVYRRRKLTEHAYAKMKNRGFGRMLVHGIAGVRSVCLLHAITHNLLHAHGLRSAAAGRETGLASTDVVEIRSDARYGVAV